MEKQGGVPVMKSRKRWWVVFMVVGVVVIVGVGMWGKIQRGRDERAIEDLKARGGRVSFVRRSGPGWLSDLSPWLADRVGRCWKPWLHVRCGIRFQTEDMVALAGVAERVTVLELNGDGRMTDRALENVERLPVLGVLALSGSGFTDECLKDVKKCRRLNSIELTRTKITDAGVAELAGMPSVTQVFLRGMKITDAGAKSLGRMTQLRDLELTESAITDVGMKEIGQLKNLNTLILRNTMITDAGLEELSRLPGLRLLILSGTRVTGRGIVALKKRVKIDEVIGHE